MSDENSMPIPRKLFSDTPKAKDPPPVPAPAPAMISPVGFSSTVILIIFLFSFSISKISDSTLLKKLSDFKNGYSLMRNGRKKFSYIDKKGEVEIKTSYKNPQPFKENRALVSNFEDGKITYSFIDTKGKLNIDTTGKT